MTQTSTRTPTGTSESTRLALSLLRQLTDTVEQLAGLSDHDLSFPTQHGCAMNGGLRRLLVHNAEHDRMHAGAISSARYAAKQMQESTLPHLTRELIRQRAELVGQLLHMDDALLDAPTPNEAAPNDEWSIRQHVEHVLYWERHSMAQIDSEMRERSLPPDAGDAE